MLCPGCGKEMERIDRSVDLKPEFMIETWNVCRSCKIGDKIRAEFFYFEGEE